MLTGALSSLTKLVMVNAVYFKSQWQNKFDTAETQIGVFHGDRPVGEVSIPMMRLRSSFFIANLMELDCRVLELPYAVSWVKLD